MPIKMRAITIALIIIIVIMGSVWFGYQLNQEKSNASSNVAVTNTAEKFEDRVLISPDGKHMAAWRQNAAGRLQNLTLIETDTGKEQILGANIITCTYQVPLWNQAGNRLYFAFTRTDHSTQTTLSYIDLSDPDPRATTEIVYSDEQGVLSGVVEIAGEAGNLLYVKKGNRVYVIDLSRGIDAVPALFTVLSL